MKMFLYLLILAGACVLGWNAGKLIKYVRDKMAQKKNKKKAPEDPSEEGEVVD